MGGAWGRQATTLPSTMRPKKSIWIPLPPSLSCSAAKVTGRLSLTCSLPTSRRRSVSYNMAWLSFTFSVQSHHGRDVFSGCGISPPAPRHTRSPPKKLIDAWIKVWMKNAVVRLPSLSLKTATGSRAAPARPLSAPLHRGATRRSLLYRGSLLVAEKGRAHYPSSTGTPALGYEEFFFAIDCRCFRAGFSRRVGVNALVCTSAGSIVMRASSVRVSLSAARPSCVFLCV